VDEAYRVAVGLFPGIIGMRERGGEQGGAFQLLSYAGMLAYRLGEEALRSPAPHTVPSASELEW